MRNEQYCLAIPRQFINSQTRGVHPQRQLHWSRTKASEKQSLAGFMKVFPHPSSQTLMAPYDPSKPRLETRQPQNPRGSAEAVRSQAAPSCLLLPIPPALHHGVGHVEWLACVLCTQGILKPPGVNCWTCQMSWIAPGSGVDVTEHLAVIRK